MKCIPLLLKKFSDSNAGSTSLWGRWGFWLTFRAMGRGSSCSFYFPSSLEHDLQLDGKKRKRMRSRPKGSEVSSIPWRKNSKFCQEAWTLEKMPSPKEWLWTSSSPIMCLGGHAWATTTAKNPRTGHTLYQEDDDQHILRKEATGIRTKTVLAPNVWNPHKLHMSSATYKQPSKTMVGNSFS